ncbi:Uncharacterised protein [Bordetella pertussis]|nr:Uncharacterised protein [Bordetella pertussis]
MRSSLTYSPRFHSLNLKGPVPMGFWLAGLVA